jgi:hypothetical protein
MRILRDAVYFSEVSVLGEKEEVLAGKVRFGYTREMLDLRQRKAVLHHRIGCHCSGNPLHQISAPLKLNAKLHENLLPGTD